jgi:hypothetical protein
LYNSRVTIKEASFSQAVAQHSKSQSKFAPLPATDMRVSC